MKFLFVLTAGPRSEAAETTAALARAAAEAGHQVDVFLAGDGVAHVASLAGQVAVTLCDADLRWRQGDPRLPQEVVRGSLRDLARLCRDSDRVLVLR